MKLFVNFMPLYKEACRESVKVRGPRGVLLSIHAAFIISIQSVINLWPLYVGIITIAFVLRVIYEHAS